MGAAVMRGLRDHFALWAPISAALIITGLAVVMVLRPTRPNVPAQVVHYPDGSYAVKPESAQGPALSLVREFITYDGTVCIKYGRHPPLKDFAYLRCWPHGVGAP